VLHGLGEQGGVGDLIVLCRIRVRGHKIPKENISQMFVIDHRGAGQHVGKEHLAQVHLEALLAAGFHHEEEGLLIAVVHQAIIEDSVGLVTPETDKLVGIAQVGAGDELDALDDLGKVPEVEHVVALLRGGEEGLQHALVEGQRGLHQGRAHVADGMLKLL